MNFGFYCLNGFLLGKTGSNISPDGTDITADLLVNIIGAVGSWNLGDLQWLISLNASLVKVIRNLHNILHITVKEIFLKYFRIIFHRNYIVNRVKIIHKSLSQNALIFLYHSNINAGICIKAVFTFSSGHLHDKSHRKENTKIYNDQRHILS